MRVGRARTQIVRPARVGAAVVTCMRQVARPDALWSERMDAFGAAETKPPRQGILASWSSNGKKGALDAAPSASVRGTDPRDPELRETFRTRRWKRGV